MRFLSSLFLPLALGAFLVPSLVAQDREVKQPQPAAIGVINDVDVTVTDLTEEKLNNPPKREIRVERVDEPLKLKLPKADPKLFEQKFAATMRLKIPNSGKYLAFLREKNGRVPPTAYPSGVRGTDPQLSQGVGIAASDFFGQLIAALPSTGAPAKEEREFLSDPKVFGELLLLTSFPDVSTIPSFSTNWELTILGTTPELVEVRATALLTTLDRGLSRPIQLTIFKQREPLCKELQEKRKAQEASQRIWSVAEEELKSYADFTSDMLSGLRVQQLQLDVDLAGVKARIAACEKLLAQPALKAERRNQIEDVKVAAEIELSGFEAKRTKSEEFVGKVKTRNALAAKSIESHFAYETARGKIRNLEEKIKNVDAAVHANAPLPLDNKITVQPLEWTQ
jgi:hypothetical protein